MGKRELRKRDDLNSNPRKRQRNQGDRSVGKCVLRKCGELNANPRPRQKAADVCLLEHSSCKMGGQQENLLKIGSHPACKCSGEQRHPVSNQQKMRMDSEVVL